MSQTVTLHREDFDTEDQLLHAISEACDLMESIYVKGDYPHLKVQRTWSKHNPIITGEMAVPSAYRWFLKRELRKLIEKGATVEIKPSRPEIGRASCRESERT